MRLPLIVTLIWAKYTVVYSINALLDICDDGEPDGVIRSEDGTILVVKTDKYWVIDEGTERAIQPGRSTEELWPGLPHDIEIGFTVQGAKVGWNNMTNRDLFVRRGIYYKYYKGKLEGSDKTTLWHCSHTGRTFDSPCRLVVPENQTTKWDFIITQFNDPVVLISVYLNTKSLFNKRPETMALIFEDPRTPELLHYTFKNFYLSRSQLLYLTPLREDRSIAFFKDSQYCFVDVDEDSQWCSTSKKPITYMFKCPDTFLQVKSTLVALVYSWFGLHINEALVIASGIIIANSLLMIELGFILLPRFLLLKDSRKGPKGISGTYDLGTDVGKHKKRRHRKGKEKKIIKFIF